jgi:hypothetical protein
MLYLDLLTSPNTWYRPFDPLKTPAAIEISTSLRSFIPKKQWLYVLLHSPVVGPEFN